MPITWRNVNSRSNNTGAALLEGAQENLAGANDQFQRVFDRRRRTEAANRDNTVDNNTAAFRDYVNSFESPEALAAAEEEGLIDHKRAEFGALLDREATRGLAQDRITGLQEQELAQNEFEDTRLRRDNRGDRNAVTGAIAEGEYGQARELLEGSDIIDRGKFMKEINASEQAAGDREQRLADERYARKRKKLADSRTDAQVARDEAERKRLAEADTMVTKLSAAREKQAEDNWRIRQEAADAVGASSENGLIDTDNMSDEQYTEFTRLLEKEGVSSVPGISESRNLFAKELREAGLGLKTAEIKEYSNTYAETIAGNRQLEPQDQAELDKRFANLDSTYTRKKEELDADHERLVTENAFAQVQPSKTEIKAELTEYMDSDEFDGGWFRFDNTARIEMGEAISEVVDEGIDGQEVTPDMIKTALNVASRQGRGDVEVFKDQLKNMVSQPGFKEMYDEGVMARERYKEKADELRTTYSKGKLATEMRFLSDRGIRPETGNEFDARLKTYQKSRNQ